VTVIDRRAARVLLVDRAGCTLLLHGGDPARPGLRWWFTPGGGLTGDETPAEGAARELFEETGLRVDPAELGEPIWHEITEFSYDNRHYRQDQDFYLLRVEEWQVDTAGMDDDEQVTITEHRWWSAAELDASTEQIFPAGLASLLRRHTVDAGGNGRIPVPEMGL
jgi:8-oxo-dGTP pyrophosphatase MutT (NUDIX family)